MSKTNLALVISVNILATLGLSEVALRFIQKGTPSYSEYTDSAASGYYASSDSNTFTLQKSYSGSQNNIDAYLIDEPSRIAVNIDSQGFRSTIKNADSCVNSKKVLLLGDSYTFGVFLRDSDTVASSLQNAANKSQKCISVINAGYANGHETDQIHSWLYQNIAKIKPDYIVYNVFAGNDINGINRTAWKDLTPNGLPRQWINPRIYVENGHIKSSRHKRSPLYIYYVPVLRESRFLSTLEERLRILTRRIGIKGAGGFKEENFAHMYGSYSRDFSSKEVIFSKLLESMSNLAVANNSKFKISYMPANFEVYPELIEKVLPGSLVFSKKSMPTNYGARICKIASDIDIQCLNITNLMLSNISSKGMPRSRLLKSNHFYPEYGEIHMSRSGAKFAGQNIYSKLIKDELE